MGLMSNEDYVFVPKVSIMEGITTGTTTKACLIGTKTHLIFVPLESEGMMGLTGRTSQYNIGDADPAAFAEAVLADPDMTAEDLVSVFEEVLGGDDHRRVFPVAELVKFKVKTGLFTGGMFWKMQGEPRKTAHIPGKAAKVAVKEFYEGQFR